MGAVTGRLAALWLAACLGAGLGLSDRQRDTAVLEGRVIDALSGRPLASATVQVGLRSVRQVIATTTSDPAGQFTFRAVPPGTYDVWASRTGYRDGGYLQRSALGPSASIEIQPREPVRTVTLRLWKDATISGRLTDARGEPMVGVQIMALEESWAFGDARLIQSRVSRRSTDDQGRFRLTSVPPGSYVVAAVGSDVQHMGSRVVPGVFDYPTVYYPGSLQSNAAVPVVVTAGDERDGIDFSIPDTTAAVHDLTVSIVGGTSGLTWTVELVPAATGPASDLDIRRTAAASDSTCVFPSVSPGLYVVRATAFADPPNVIPYGRTRMYVPMFSDPSRVRGSSFWAEREVVLGDSSPDPVHLQARQAARIRGTVAFEGPSPLPDAMALRLGQIFVESAEGRLFYGRSTAALDGDHRFVTGGLPPGQYVIDLPFRSSGWWLESLTVDGRVQCDGVVMLGEADLDVAITLTDTPTALVGTVRDEQLKAVAGASVFVFAARRQDWRWQTVHPLRIARAPADALGRFRIAGLVPGEYYVAAVADDVPDQWRNPAYLSALIPRADRVTLTPSTTQRLDLVLR